MKEVAGKAKASGGTAGMRRTETEKEKTKMRERQRRAITTNIFHGLRKHGGYLLSPRADINEVLRELAKEAGWIILPDGTTFRSSSSPHGWGCCPVCGLWRASNNSATPTPSSTVVVDGGGRGTEYCSTTASPVRDSMNNINGGGGGGVGGSTMISSLYVPFGGGASADDADIPLDQLCMYGGMPAYPEQLYVQEARASNQNTPEGSPLRRH